MRNNVVNIEGGDFHEASSLDDGWRRHLDGGDIKLGARSISAAGLRATVLWATELRPAYLQHPGPAGLHRISLSAGVRSSSARVRTSSARLRGPSARVRRSS